MKLQLRRVILFVKDVERVAEFYRDVLGLVPVTNERDQGWEEFEGGDCSLALHQGGGGKKPPRGPKVVFWAKDVAATRKKLVERGAKLGAVKVFGTLHLCDGKDPEGNAFQLSNRP